MQESTVIGIAAKMLLVTGEVAAPILIVSLAVGLAVSLIQSITQIQEATLSFVPKLAAVSIVIVVAGNWMLTSIVSFTQQMYNMIPQLLSAH